MQHIFLEGRVGSKMIIKPFKDDSPYLLERLAQHTGKTPPNEVLVFTDTSEFMDIQRGHIIRLKDQDFYVLSDMREMRCGLCDPKFWVKKCIDLSDGSTKILKLTFQEEFTTRVGQLTVQRFRSPEKEAKVLERVREDPRFMQGQAMYDDSANIVRVIDFIKGRSLFEILTDLEVPHKEYYTEIFPRILQKLILNFQAIDKLHCHNLCHGDTRNDHILIEEGTGQFKWIDFDYQQNFVDFDIWGLGNIINFCLAKGIPTIQELQKRNLWKKRQVEKVLPQDMAAFFPYRIMNLQKIYPYISDELAHVLGHFSSGTQVFYENVSELIMDLKVAYQQLINQTSLDINDKSLSIGWQDNQKSKRILVVDDDPDLLFIIEKILESELKDLEITTARSANTALKMLRRQNYDLVISDVMMPDIGGLELCQIIKDIKQEINIIMMSAHGSMITAQRSVQRGANDFIVKPISTEELTHKVSNLIKPGEA